MSEMKYKPTTALDAVEKSIIQWGFLTETGKEKEDWAGWEKYGEALCNCFLCEFTSDSGCDTCPLVTELGVECSETAYIGWEHASNVRTRKKYAGKFLETLRQVRDSLLKKEAKK